MGSLAEPVSPCQRFGAAWAAHAWEKRATPALQTDLQGLIESVDDQLRELIAVDQALSAKAKLLLSTHHQPVPPFVFQSTE